MTKIVSHNITTHQVLPLDALLFPLPVECAVREANERRVTGHIGFLPSYTPWSGPGRKVRQLPKKSLVLSIDAPDLVIGE